MQRVFNARVRRKLPSKRLTEMTHCNLISSHSRALSYTRLGRHCGKGAVSLTTGTPRTTTGGVSMYHPCALPGTGMAKRSPASVASTPKTRYGIRNAFTTADSSARDLRRTDEHPVRASGQGGDGSRPPGRPSGLSRADLPDHSGTGDLNERSVSRGVRTSWPDRTDRSPAPRRSPRGTRSPIRSELQVCRAVDSPDSGIRERLVTGVVEGELRLLDL